MQKNAPPRVASRDFFSVAEIGRQTEALFGTGEAADRLDMLRVLDAWSRAVGAHLITVARPTSCKGGRLLVEVRDAAWKKELDRLKPDILVRLSGLLPSPSVLDIVFRAGRSPVDAGAPSAACADPVGREAPRWAEPAPGPSARTQAPPPGRMSDAHLKERFSRVVGRYLASAR